MAPKPFLKVSVLAFSADRGRSAKSKAGSAPIPPPPPPHDYPALLPRPPPYKKRCLTIKLATIELVSRHCTTRMCLIRVCTLCDGACGTYAFRILDPFVVQCPPFPWSPRLARESALAVGNHRCSRKPEARRKRYQIARMMSEYVSSGA